MLGSAGMKGNTLLPQASDSTHAAKSGRLLKQNANSPRLSCRYGGRTFMVEWAQSSEQVQI